MSEDPRPARFLLDDIEAPAAPRIEIVDLVAEPGFAPRDWQSAAPVDVWDTNRHEVEPSAELERVLALPWRAPPEPDGVRSEALIEMMTARYRKPDGPCRCAVIGPKDAAGVPQPCILRLRFVQAWTLYEAPQAGGILGQIGVGHGKTLLDFVVALAMANLHPPKGQIFVAVLLVPASLMKQAVGDYQLLEQHWHMPRAQFHGRGETDRQFAGTRPGVMLHVLSFDRLSRPENTAWLLDTKPDLIIADECDKLSDIDTARTSRFMRYLDEHRPLFCGWSGSLSDASITDYAHLARAALDKGSPLPRDLETTNEWSRALDPGPKGADPAPPGALMRLCDPEIVDDEGRGEHIHAAFYRRLTGTLGVIHTTTSSHDAPVIFEELNPGAVPDEIADHLSLLRGEWVRPDGWTYDNALEMSACARQLACGFYYYWHYPRGEPQALIEEWLDTRRAWCAELRAVLKNRSAYLDSEKLLKEAAMRFHGDLPPNSALPSWESRMWVPWRKIRDRVVPEPRPMLLDPFLADHAASWAASNRGIIWYESTAYGRWIAERAELPLYGGPGTAPLVDSKGKIRENGSRSMIASINSHGRGRNGLQFVFHDQLVAQPPSSPKKWEQVLGRLARPGQTALEVGCKWYGHTSELRAFVQTAIGRARYVRGTLGQAQRILTGLDPG